MSRRQLVSHQSFEHFMEFVMKIAVILRTPKYKTAFKTCFAEVLDVYFKATVILQ